MSALLQQVMGSIDASVIQQLSGRMGVSAEQAQSAIGSALPSLLSAFEQHAGSGAGADAIHTLAQRFSGGTAGGSEIEGLLGQIAGGMQGGTAGLAQAAGVSNEQGGHLMAVLGPVVLAALGQHAASNGSGAQSLQQWLGAAANGARSPAGSDVGSMLGGLLGKL